MKKGKYVLMGFGWVLFGAMIITLMGFAVMLLWNWLIPELFAGSTITFIQSIGLILLAKLLTGFGGWGRNHSWGKGHHYKSHYWKKRWDEKLANMSPEEKERFKAMYYDRCGWKSFREEKKETEAAAE
ncbi:MAG: hypothetical protein ACKVPJ_06950 [Chitinophagales bacterium]